MWFLWGLITFFIVIFSSSQIVSYIVCFMRYPEMMENMQKYNKNLIIGGLVLHTIIHIVGLTLICLIPCIRRYWWVCLLVFIIGLCIGISSVKKDATLKQNFAKLTGYEDRERIRKQVEDYIEKIQILNAFNESSNIKSEDEIDTKNIETTLDN